VVATVLFALYYLNYVIGWVLPEMIDLFDAPAPSAMP
jgi:hypothetical protein